VPAWLFATDRLAVRPKRLADAAPLHAVYGDEEVMRHLGGRLDTPARTRDFVAAHVRHQKMYGFSMWALTDRSIEVVGDVGFLRHEDGIEIGWHLCRATRGRGYATEAARACLAYGFDELGFEQVSAFVELANAASLHVVEKLGMSLVRRGADGVPPWAEFATTRREHASVRAQRVREAEDGRGSQSRPGELGGGRLGVQRVGVDELGVRADRADPAGFEDDDGGGVDDGG
jgi:ribosomal-protein-alanine N-acetyltransferase